MNAEQNNAQGIYGPAGDRDASRAYLFLCLENGRYAVSYDRTGANIPLVDSMTGWKLISDFALGVKEALPFPADPEPILAALRADGYYVFAAGRSLARFGDLA
jgi:hypothetical protein